MIARCSLLFVAATLLLALGGGTQAANLASADAGAVVSGPRNASGSAGRAMAANDGEVAGYGPNQGYAWGWFGEPLTVTFPAATTINKVEVLLLDVDARQSCVCQVLQIGCRVSPGDRLLALRWPRARGYGVAGLVSEPV